MKTCIHTCEHGHMASRRHRQISLLEICRVGLVRLEEFLNDAHFFSPCVSGVTYYAHLTKTDDNLIMIYLILIVKIMPGMMRTPNKNKTFRLPCPVVAHLYTTIDFLLQ